MPDRDTDYAERIAAIHRTLGIPADYAVARKLALQVEADERELREVAVLSDGRRVKLEPPAAAAWRAMEAAAALDGVAIQAISGFRSVARQTELVERKLRAGETVANTLRLVAAPGFSEHHTGCAVDIGTPGEPPLEESFAATAAFAWLERRAGEFGFHLSYPKGNAAGIAYEPWHWCWRAKR